MYGLVLEGGGARGSYEIGVFKAITELNISIQAVTGTSVGALNGAFFAQHRFQEAYDLWYNMDNGLVLNTDTDTYSELINFDLKKANWKKYYSYFTDLFSDGGLDISPLKKLIHKYVDEERLRNSDIAFGLVTVSLTERKPLEVFIDEIPKGEIHDFLLASAYLPGFKQEKLDDEIYIDGGFHDNTPINLMTKKGVKDIIVVRLKAIGLSQKPKEKDLNTIEISPTDELGSMLDFSRDLARKNIELGYYDAMRILDDQVRGFRYALKNVPDEAYFEQYLMNSSDSLIEHMAKELSIEMINPKRTLFEKIVPELALLCDLKDTDSYQTIFIKMAEIIAEYFGINRLQFYDYREFFTLIEDRSKEENQKRGITERDWKNDPALLDKLPKMLKKHTIFKKAFKIPLLLKLLQIKADEE